MTCEMEHGEGARMSLAFVQYLGERRSGALDDLAPALIVGSLQRLLDAPAFLGKVAQKTTIIRSIISVRE